jgi:hypothetical protein
MTWTEATLDETTTEWERSDGNATIRLRRRHDGSCTVRLDRLFQAPDGQLYRHERADNEELARALVDSWRTEFDVEN